MDTTKCALGATPPCGWNAEVAAQRRECIRQQGLMRCADGLRRLVIKRAQENAAPGTGTPEDG